MIEFTTYEEVMLEDVADYERAKKGYVYPAGSSTIQISASRGEIDFLDKKSEVDSKNVVVIPQAGINRKYFNVVLQKNIKEFMSKYATGINIQEKEIGKFPIQLHNSKTQEVIAETLKRMDDQLQDKELAIVNIKEFKRAMLDKIMI